MSLYLPILKTAWRTAIRQRRLWWYALFAGLLIGSGIGTAIIQVLGANPTRVTLGGGTLEGGAIGYAFDLSVSSTDRIAPLWEQARATGVGATIALTTYGVLLLALLGMVVWLAVIGTNALILAAARTGRDASIPRDLRRQAQRSFWPTFGIHLCVKVTTIILLIAWGSVLGATATNLSTIATARGAAAFVATTLLLIIIHTVTPYAIASAVLDHRSAGSALREGFALLRTHWLITVEMSALLSIANIVNLIVWIAGSVLLALPFLFSIGTALTRGAAGFLPPAFALGIVVLIAYLALIAMVFTTFLTTAWTLLFLRLTGPGEEPDAWLHRVFRTRKPESTIRMTKSG